MNNKQAAKILKELKAGMVPDTKFGKQVAAAREAITLAIAALESPLLAVDYKKEGAKGGAAVVKKFGRKQMAKWGKLGGRPKKKAA